MRTNTLEIMEVLRPEKLIFLCRHGFKTAEGHITLECLQHIVSNGIPGAAININVIHCGTGFVRTEETVTALSLWLMQNGSRPKYGIEADSRLGDQTWLDLFPPIQNEGAKRRYNYYQMLKHLDPDGFARWNQEINGAILDTFDMMAVGDVCAMVAHSPSVEMTYNLFADKEDENFSAKEMEGIFLLMDSEGKVTAIR